ncbi:hypothetical protein E2C01_051640 [Portunus trituberculatus]|uniref:Uncharacterized protein n=1 Tax=Portunus trituberculatus TaxID=210409 RepID=A0A5B7GJW7_PORTR|nr:hypothetical protein [Portunus trituberculatus]
MAGSAAGGLGGMVVCVAVRPRQCLGERGMQSQYLHPLRCGGDVLVTIAEEGFGNARCQPNT